MHLLTRAARRFAFLLPFLAIAAAPVAVVAASPEPVGWLYRGSDIPPDREWVFGELNNGLRYAVRRNGVPPGQVSVRIVMDVGSMYERDNERGYAHLLEHLVFRQSKYLGEAQAIPTWQRLGATFGSDTNAETSPTQTVYKLDLPDATPAKLDESMRLLSGMMAEPTLSEANVRTEVPIVLAEKRESGGTAERVFDRSREVMFAGQPLATRSPIGTVETLTAANQASVRAFHARWYRPERAVVIVAGDMDPATLQSYVTRWFSGWRGRGRMAPSPSFGDPVAPAGAPAGGNPVGEVKVLVEPDLPRSLSVAILRPWRPVTDNIAYNQGLMIDALAQQIINRRLEARARGGGSYLLAQVAQEDVSRSVDGTFISVNPLENDWQGALRDVRGVIADAMTTAPTIEEIAREVAEMNVAFESSVEQRRLLPGARVADDLVRALDIRETVASPETVLDIFNRSRPLFTPEAVLAHTRTLFAGTVERAVYLTPDASEATDASLRMAMLEAVAPDGRARLNSRAISFAEMPPIGTPVAPTSIRPTGLLGIEQVDFANGVKVLIWPTQDEPGRTTVKVRFGAGYRAFGPDDAAYITLGNMALVGSGVGPLDQEELDQISTGRKMGFDFGIQDAVFEFSADTRPSDLNDQLYLFAAKFATPRWDENPVARAKAAARLQYESYATSPQGVLERDLRFYQRNRDPRFRTPTPQEIAAATPEGFRRVWAPILANGPIEVQIFGDFDRATALETLQRTFGALPRRAPLPAGTAPATARSLEPSPTPVVLNHRGDANQAAGLVSWPTGGGQANVRESRKIQILTEIFSNRLMEAMRERMGASYSPQVWSEWPLDLDNGGAITAYAQMQPEDVPAFFATAESIAADLARTPPSADEIARVIEPLRQQLARASTSATFFMFQLEGATEDPRRIDALRTLMADLTRTTPEEMQGLARRYFGPGLSAKLAVIPAGQQLATEIRPHPAPSPTARRAQPAETGR